MEFFKNSLFLFLIVFLKLFEPSECQTTSSPGPPLRPFTSRPSFEKLKSKIETKVVEGQPVTMSASISEENGGKIVKCQWTSPFGVVYDVEEKSLKSTSGKIIDGLSGNITDSKSCFITIKNLKKPAMGTWQCRIVHSGSPIFQEVKIAATSNGKSSQMRLTKSVMPQKYVIFLTPFIEKDNYTIQGHVETDILVKKKSVRSITLHSQDLKIFENSVKVLGVNQENYEIIGFGYEEATHFLTIYLSKELPVDSKLKLSIDYLGELKEDLMGFYRSSYFNEETNSTEFLATTQFEAVGARKALPCFDEPSFKAVFQVNLGRIKNMTSISNMPLEKEGVSMSDNDVYVWDVYKETPKMSTYLLAFVISRFNFRQSKTEANNVQFRIWSRKSVMDQTVLASEIGTKILMFYENVFKVKFPLPKQDMIAIPDFMMGAMENWGLITYREVYLLNKAEKSSAADKELTELVIAHELSHQWFGNLVTMEWWTDLWLNEGFARYMQNFGAQHVQSSDTGILDRIVTSYTMTVMDKDAQQSSHPISVVTDDPEVILSNFDTISYDKGASIIRMMANFIGTETFSLGIVNYLNKYKYGNAAKDDLWQTMTEVGHKTGSLDKKVTIKEIMDTWTVQMGFPVINVDILYDKNPLQVNISQKRFLLFEDKSIKEKRSYKWWVPLSYTTPGGDFNATNNWLWLSPKDESKIFSLNDIKDSKQPLIFNKQHFGFYKVNYSPANWDRLSKSLEDDHLKIHRLNRAQILKDSLSLARADLLEYKIALGTTKYLSKEMEFIPWSPAISELTYLGQMLYKSAGHSSYKEFMFKQLGPLFSKLGLMPKGGDGFMDIQLRALVVKTLCDLEYEPCVKAAIEVFKSKSLIPSDVRQTVYCTVLGQSDESEWNSMWKLYLQSSINLGEREDILNALGCTKVTSVLQKLLEMSINSSSGIRKQDGLTVISGIAKNPDGRDIAWNWLFGNWKSIGNYFDVTNSVKIGNVVKTCTETFNKESELEKLNNFFVQNQDFLGTATSGTKSSIQTVKANVQWMTQHFKEVADLFQNEFGKQKLS